MSSPEILKATLNHTAKENFSPSQTKQSTYVKIKKNKLGKRKTSLRICILKICIQCNILIPKPEIKISEEIAVDEELITQPEPVLMPETKEEDSTTKSVPQSLQPLTEAEQNRCTKVFIERTKFFNDTSTNAFFMDISQIIEENPYLCVSMSSQEADYIVKTNVLRAKVDPINKQTNRMQMVISLELTDVENATSIVEHQNRFLLFESTEDEQKVAADLLKKLLIKGSKKIAPRIKAKADISKEVITPSASVIKVYKQQN